MGTRRLSWRPLVSIAGAVVLAASHNAAWATDTALLDQSIPVTEVSNAVSTAVDNATVEDAVDVADEVEEDAEATVSEEVDEDEVKEDAQETASDDVDKVEPTKTAVQSPGDNVVSPEIATASETDSSPADGGGTGSGRDSSGSSAGHKDAHKDKNRKDRNKDNAKELVSAGHEIQGPLPVRSRVKGLREIQATVSVRSRDEGSVASRLAHTGVKILGYLLVALALITSGGGARTASGARGMPTGTAMKSGGRSPFAAASSVRLSRGWPTRASKAVVLFFWRWITSDGGVHTASGPRAMPAGIG